MMNKLLGKLNDAIDTCEEENVTEAQIKLSYAELLLVRKYELTNEYSTSLTFENLNKGRNFNSK